MKTQHKLSDREIRKLPFRGRGLENLKEKLGNVEEFISIRQTTSFKILEIGCGFGQLLIELAYKYGSLIELYGLTKPGDFIDIQKAVEIAKYKGAVPQNFYPSSSIQFIFWDANLKLPFPDNYFDLIISQVCFSYIHDKLGLLNETSRILSPTGAAVLHVEFEHTKARETTSEKWNTLEIYENKSLLDLSLYFSQLPNIVYSQHIEGSILKITGKPKINFNARLESVEPFTNLDYHGVRSIYITNSNF